MGNDNLGIFHSEKSIIHNGSVHWAVLIHEMGHVFAAENDPAQKRVEEYDFLGWECALVRQVKASMKEWKEHNDDYELNNPVAGYKEFAPGSLAKSFIKKDEVVPFKWLSDKEKNMVIRERVAHAKKIGLIVDNKPISIR